jgi:hypothetical protein
VTEILSSSSQTTSWIGIELNAAGGVHPRQPQTVRNSPSTFSVFFFLFSFFIVPKLICFIILCAGKKKLGFSNLQGKCQGKDITIV